MRRAELFGRRFVRLLPQDFKNGKWLCVCDCGNTTLAAIRLNEGNVERHTLDRLASFVDLVTGTRITYEQLKGGKTWVDADSLAQEM